jgi:hypothetical protein
VPSCPPAIVTVVSGVERGVRVVAGVGVGARGRQVRLRAGDVGRRAEVEGLGVRGRRSFSLVGARGEQRQHARDFGCSLSKRSFLFSWDVFFTGFAGLGGPACI